MLILAYTTDEFSSMYSCQYVIILKAGERYNLFSCPGHLQFNYFVRNDTLCSRNATRLVNYLVSSMTRA